MTRRILLTLFVLLSLTIPTYGQSVLDKRSDCLERLLRRVEEQLQREGGAKAPTLKSESDLVYSHFVDLRDTDGLERLKQSNPSHFEKVSQILSGVVAALEVARDVRDMADGMLMTYPPKGWLLFTLDDTRYLVFSPSLCP